MHRTRLKRLMTGTLAGALFVGAFAGVPRAAEDQTDKLAAEFRKLDKDGDSRLSLDEYRLSKRSEASFRKLDKDSDGRLTLEEFRAHR